MNLTRFPVTASRMSGRIACLTLLLLVVCATANAQPKIVFVDFEQVFTNFYKTKLANDQLLEMSDGMNREQMRMQVEFDMLQVQFRNYRDQAMQEGLSETNVVPLRKKADESLIEMRRVEDRIKQYGQIQQKRWEEQNRRIRNNLIDELRGKIARYGKAKGYLAIFDKAQVNEKGVPGVLYQDEEADVTAEVIDEVNR